MTVIQHPDDVPVSFHPVSTSLPMDHVLKQGISFRSNHFIEPETLIEFQIHTQEAEFSTRGQVSKCVRHQQHFHVTVQLLNHEQLHQLRMAEQLAYITHYQNVQEAHGRQISPEEAAGEWILKYAAYFPQFKEA